MIKHKTRETYMSRHHLIPKIRGGTYSKKNLLHLWRDRHNLWHNIFSVLTIHEIINLLDKGRYAREIVKNVYWKQLFKEKSARDVQLILIRIRRIKKHLRKQVLYFFLFVDQQSPFFSHQTRSGSPQQCLLQFQSTVPFLLYKYKAYSVLPSRVQISIPSFFEFSR